MTVLQRARGKRRAGMAKKEPTAISVMDPLQRDVEWSATGDPTEPYSSLVGQDEWKVRINDFPDERLYTLVVNGKALTGLDDWPSNWSRPAETDAVVFQVRGSELFSKPLDEITGDFEAELIRAALEKTKGNRGMAAKRLGIGIGRLERRLKKRTEAG